MSSLEQPFKNAIERNEIDSTIIVGKDTTGSFEYKFIHGNRTLLDGTKKPLSETDILYLASTTKLFTTIAALHCVETGLLSLDSPIDSLAPELSSQPILSGYDPSTNSPILKPNTKPITLRHLLTHSSGLPYDFFSPDLTRYNKEHPIPPPTPTVQTRYAYPLTFAPGEGWLYGPGIDWAGLLVERASSMDLETYIQKHILTPLSIPLTDFSFFPVKNGMASRMVDVNPSDPEGSGRSVGGGSDFHKGVTAMFGGQGGYATAGAVGEVLYSLLANDGRVLRKESVLSMFTPQLESGARDALRGLAESPLFSFFAQGQGDGANALDYGLGGLYIGGESELGGLGKGSLAWGGGINSAWIVDPKNGICGFAAPQLGPEPSMEKAKELKDVFRKQLKVVAQESQKK